MRLMRSLAGASVSVLIAAGATVLGAPPSGRVVDRSSQGQAIVPAPNTGFTTIAERGEIIPIHGFVDCNNNGIDDSTDIAICQGSPACDDCNLNDVPDECDIADQTSQDADANGVPDECGSSVGDCPPRLVANPMTLTPALSRGERGYWEKRSGSPSIDVARTADATEEEASGGSLRNGANSGLVSEGGCQILLWSAPASWSLGGLYPNDLDPVGGVRPP